MRDLIVVAIVFGGLPYVIMRPWVGILMFAWLSYMNPHRLTWGFAYSFPFAQVVALVTMVSLVTSKERNKLVLYAPVVILLTYLVWQSITTLYALESNEAQTELLRTLKIQVMVLLTLIAITRPKHLIYLVWVVAFSIAFFGIKGGVFTILSGGSFRIWGPDGSFIEGNNEIGLALLMVVPMMVYLARKENRKWLRYFIWLSIALCILSAVATYSRGALVGLICMVGFLWLKSRYKFASFMVILMVAATIGAFMPKQWYDRMETTSDYEADESAMGRIAAWQVAISVAADRPTGGGYQMWSRELFQKYGWTEKAKSKKHDAHSIYFEVLGEHGYFGLILFVSFIITGWLQGRFVIRKAREHPELTDIANLCKMLQVGLIAYLSAGAFLGLASFDLFYQMVAMMMLARLFVTRHLNGQLQPEWSAVEESNVITVKKPNRISDWLPPSPNALT